jgi:hypothetical protein
LYLNVHIFVENRIILIHGHEMVQESDTCMYYHCTVLHICSGVCNNNIIDFQSAIINTVIMFARKARPLWAVKVQDSMSYTLNVVVQRQKRLVGCTLRGRKRRKEGWMVA